MSEKAVIPRLDPDGTPAIGDWFRAVGYTTHYFGKWHVSDPPSPGSLEPWGFSDGESSYPEPHGGDRTTWASTGMSALREMLLSF